MKNVTEELLEKAEEALRGLLRMCEAARYTAGWGKNQMQRIEDAKAALSAIQQQRKEK